MLSPNIPYGIMFHHFFSDEHPKGQGAISANQLRKIINFIGRENILSADEWMNRKLTDSLEENQICLTFDDGLRCQYDIALPVLEDFGITAFWMVYSSSLLGTCERLELYRYYRTIKFAHTIDFYENFYTTIKEDEVYKNVLEAIENFNPKSYLQEYSFYSDQDREFRYIRDNVIDTQTYFKIMDKMLEDSGIKTEKLIKKLWMDNTCIQNLHNKNHQIGLHTHSHPTRVDLLPESEQLKEYKTNFMHLSELINQPIKAMSHPCNRYNKKTLELLKKLGIVIGFRANLEQKKYTSLECPRNDHMHILKMIPL